MFGVESICTNQKEKLVKEKKKKIIISVDVTKTENEA